MFDYLKRRYMHIRIFQLAVLVVLLLAFLTPRAYADTSADFDIPNGHFFSEAAGPNAAPGSGYAITDEGTDSRGQTIKFWSEFKRLGGVNALGYPASRRFLWNGFVCQVMQRAVLQWRPEANTVYFVNVTDLITAAGRDDYLLAARQTPKPADFTAAEQGMTFQQIVQKRYALLDANPAIKAKYFSVSDPLNLNGLPTAPIADMGDAYVLRAQRIIIQQWKKDMPWAKAGGVTVALGGDIAKEVGLIQAQDAQSVVPQVYAVSGYTVAQLAPEIQRAYLTLTQRVAVPVDKVKIATAGLTGLAQALNLNAADKQTLLATQFSSNETDNARILANRFSTLSIQASGKQPELLMRAMIASMAIAVNDEHTYYLDPDVAARQAASLRGDNTLVGIGVATLRSTTGAGPLIIDVYPGSPAEKAGLMSGDVILKVNGQDVTVPNIDYSALIRGDEGTQVTLVIQRSGTPGPLTFTLVRAKVPQPVISSRAIGTIGYIRIYEFVDSASYPLVDRVKDALKQLDQQGIQGLVLDLRGNPGGSAQQLQLIASLFVPNPDHSKTAGTFRDARGNQIPLPLTGSLWSRQYPIAILINEASGSAAEIMPLTMREYGAAYLIGERTAGALGITTPIALIDKSELWYTAYVHYAPVSHTSYNGTGITPDQVIPDRTPVDYMTHRDPQLDAALAYLLARTQ